MRKVFPREQGLGLGLNLGGKISESLHVDFLLFWPTLNRPPGRRVFLSYLNFKYLPGASQAESYKYFLLVLPPRCGSLEGCPTREKMAFLGDSRSGGQEA